MGEYTGRIEVARPADQVFGFLSDIRNLPLYLPTVTHAGPQGPDKVAVEGEAEGYSYRAEGWLRSDPAGRRMEWGADSATEYQGRLEVEDLGDRSAVALRLVVEPEPEVAARMQRAHGSVDHGLRLALERTLGAIRAACEEGGLQPANKDTTRSAEDLPDSRNFGSTATLNPDI